MWTSSKKMINGVIIKMTRRMLAALGMMIAVSPAALAQDMNYFGVAMFNSHYIANRVDHRSTGLMGRIGRDISRHFAAEVHFGGSIGPQSNLSATVGRAQIDSLYGGFVRANSAFGLTRLYLLGGITYGTRVLAATGTAAATRDHDTNKSFGFGIEFSEKGAFKLVLEGVRYFDNRYYRVDAWNVGVVTHF